MSGDLDTVPMTGVDGGSSPLSVSPVMHQTVLVVLPVLCVLGLVLNATAGHVLQSRFLRPLTSQPILLALVLLNCGLLVAGPLYVWVSLILGPLVTEKMVYWCFMVCWSHELFSVSISWLLVLWMVERVATMGRSTSVWAIWRVTCRHLIVVILGLVFVATLGGSMMNRVTSTDLPTLPRHTVCRPWLDAYRPGVSRSWVKVMSILFSFGPCLALLLLLVCLMVALSLLSHRVHQLNHNQRHYQAMLVEVMAAMHLRFVSSLVWVSCLYILTCLPVGLFVYMAGPNGTFNLLGSGSGWSFHSGGLQGMRIDWGGVVNLSNYDDLEPAKGRQALYPPRAFPFPNGTDGVVRNNLDLPWTDSLGGNESQSLDARASRRRNRKGDSTATRATTGAEFDDVIDTSLSSMTMSSPEPRMSVGWLESVVKRIRKREENDTSKLGSDEKKGGKDFNYQNLLDHAGVGSRDMENSGSVDAPESGSSFGGSVGDGVGDSGKIGDALVKMNGNNVVLHSSSNQDVWSQAHQGAVWRDTELILWLIYYSFIGLLVPLLLATEPLFRREWKDRCQALLVSRCCRPASSRPDGDPENPTPADQEEKLRRLETGFTTEDVHVYVNEGSLLADLRHGRPPKDACEYQKAPRKASSGRSKKNKLKRSKSLPIHYDQGGPRRKNAKKLNH